MLWRRGLVAPAAGSSSEAHGADHRHGLPLLRWMENGAPVDLELVNQLRYPNSSGPPAVVAPLVAELIRHLQHRFWPDSQCPMWGWTLMFWLRSPSLSCAAISCLLASKGSPVAVGVKR